MMASSSQASRMSAIRCSSPRLKPGSLLDFADAPEATEYFRSAGSWPTDAHSK